jgi:hypothetical protein
MKHLTVLCATALLLAFSVGAVAELDSTTVGGSQRVRFQSLFDSAFDNDSAADAFVESRTRLNVLAEYSQDVALFIELQSYNIWGEDFSSNTSTAFGGFEVNEFGNGRGRDSGDVDLYQGYINMADAFAVDGLNIRFGRQEMQFGVDARTGEYNEFVVGNNDTNRFFSGLSFDAIRVSYAVDNWSVDAWWSKLAELRTLSGDVDTDFYGIYISYTGFENNILDLYWLYVRDAKDPLGAANTSFNLGQAESDNDEFHTLGARVSGVWNEWDYNLEGAFQFGDAEIGAREGDYEGWAIDFGLGYTFENVAWEPRVNLGVAYFTGDDDLTDDDVEGFNRVFSDKEYGELIDGGELSNAIVVHLGVDAQPTEKIGLGLEWLWFQADEDDVEFNNSIGIPGLPPFLVFPVEIDTDEDLGHEVDLYMTYAYSEDLQFKLGYSHFFTDDGIEEGTLSTGNNQFAFGATDDDDVDYFFLEASLSF